MGVKRVLPAYQLIPNAGDPTRAGFPPVSGAMTGTSTITSNATNIEFMDNIGFQVLWTGTPVGNFYVFCSIDGINYIALTFAPALGMPAGVPGGFLINLQQLPYPWIKFQYINTSGSGTLSVYICGKDVN
jgi:hypothetical protein